MKEYDFELPIDPDDPPKEVINWIARLKRCFTEAPPGLWFNAGTGGLSILATGVDGKRVALKDYEHRLDADYIIATAGEEQDIDGGDPW